MKISRDELADMIYENCMFKLRMISDMLDARQEWLLHDNPFEALHKLPDKESIK